MPLEGLPGSPRLIPRGADTLPVGHQRVRFHWRYRDPEYETTGDGAARTAFPDSARLDFFVSGPLGGSGYALLFDDTLVAPGAKRMRHYLPPTPFLWATLGRLAVPPTPDTLVRVDGDTVRADIGPATTGKGTVWRVSFVNGELTGLARLSGGRVHGWLVREVGRGRIRYDDGSRRTLTLTQVRSEAVPAFDPSIWTP